jgi:DNA-binding IclR family transcriptional regulator
MLFKNERKLERLTPHTRTALDDLISEHAVVRREGIACDNEEYMPGLRCIAAPVRDFSARIVAAMSLSMFKHKMTAARRALFKAALLQAGADLSQKLGFAPDSRKAAS